MAFSPFYQKNWVCLSPFDQSDELFIINMGHSSTQNGPPLYGDSQKLHISDSCYYLTGPVFSRVNRTGISKHFVNFLSWSFYAKISECSGPGAAWSFWVPSFWSCEKKEKRIVVICSFRLSGMCVCAFFYKLGINYCLYLEYTQLVWVHCCNGKQELRECCWNQSYYDRMYIRSASCFMAV